MYHPHNAPLTLTPVIVGFCEPRGESRVPLVPPRKPPRWHLGRDGAATSLAEDASSSLLKRRLVRLLTLSHSPGCSVGVMLALAYCLAANIDLRASRRNEEVALIHQHIVVGLLAFVFFFIRRKCHTGSPKNLQYLPRSTCKNGGQPFSYYRYDVAVVYVCFFFFFLSFIQFAAEIVCLFQPHSDNGYPTKSEKNSAAVHATVCSM